MKSASLFDHLSCCLTIVSCLQNNPLFIEVFSKQEALPFHYIVHCALDAVEEKGKGVMCSLPRSTSAAPLKNKLMLPAVTAPRKGPSDLIDAYLGLLYPTEDYKVSLLEALLLWHNLLKHKGPRCDGDQVASCTCCGHSSDAKGLMACRCMGTSATRA